MQEMDSENFLVAYHSRKLRPSESYSIFEKELLAVVKGFKNYYFYSYGDEFIF